MTESNTSDGGAEEISFVNSRPDSLIDRALNAVGVGVFVLLLSFGVLQILNRFVFASMVGVSVAWTGEASRFLLIYMTLIGGVIASRDHDHVQIEVLLNRLPLGVRPLAQAIVHLVSIVFIVAAAYGGYLAMQSAMGVPPGAVPFITLEYVYVVIPVGFALMGVYELRSGVQFLREFANSGGREHE